LGILFVPKLSNFDFPGEHTMLNGQKPNKTIVMLLAAAAACLMAAGCYKQYYFPVVIGELTLSPIYRLEIQNDTSQALIFLPREEAGKRVKEKRIPVGENFTTLLQIKKVAVEGDVAREVVTGSYIGSGRPGQDTACIKYIASGRLREFTIDIGNDSWFGSYETNRMNPKPMPKTLKVRLTDQNLAKSKWFRDGPNHP